MADTTEEDILQHYSRIKKKYSFDEVLKTEQIEGMMHSINGSNTLCVLPTGYGKSLIYMLLPLLWDEMNPMTKHSVLVVSPLLSLMADQAKEAGKRKIAVGLLTGETSDAEKDAIKKGEKSLIYGSPESVTKAVDYLADDVYPRKLCAIVVDECHNIIDWEDFRPIYKDLPFVKTIVASKVPWMLLTATCDERLKDGIIKGLHIEDISIVAASPNRPNIFLSVKTEKAMKVPDNFAKVAEDLRERKANAAKMIVYCRSKEACGEIFCYLMSTLRDDAFIQVEGNRCRLIEQYSSSYTDKDAERIIDRVTSNDPSLRCIITTIALGMGVNMAGVTQVIHWGASDNLLRYWQEIGRAGRGGEYSQALLLAYPTSLIKVAESMKGYIKAFKENTCLRVEAMKALVIKDCTMDTLPTKENCNKECVDCECDACRCCVSCQNSCSCNKDV